MNTPHPTLINASDELAAKGPEMMDSWWFAARLHDDETAFWAKVHARPDHIGHHHRRRGHPPSRRAHLVRPPVGHPGRRALPGRDASLEVTHRELPGSDDTIYTGACTVTGTFEGQRITGHGYTDIIG